MVHGIPRYLFKYYFCDYNDAVFKFFCPQNLYVEILSSPKVKGLGAGALWEVINSQSEDFVNGISVLMKKAALSSQVCSACGSVLWLSIKHYY
jgi:hypothetical protein